MSHFKTSEQERSQLSHEATPTLSSKSSSTTPTMAASKGLYDQDKLVKLSKTYRQALSTAPAAAISVLAGVSLYYHHFEALVD